MNTNKAIDLSLSCGDKGSKNILIQGDNLEVLELLKEEYKGKVKCIYIDPPYNTRRAFEHYKDRNNRRDWSDNIRIRLILLKEFLHEEGSIWVSIDDREAHYLKVIMDEVFGRNNFITNLIWQRKTSTSNDAKHFSPNHDHILVYSKNKKSLKINRLQRTKELDSAYKNPDEHPKGYWMATPLSTQNISLNASNFKFTFKNGVVWSPPDGKPWRFTKENLAKFDKNDEIYFGKDGNSEPKRKTFLSELKYSGPPPSTVWLAADVGCTTTAKKETLALNEGSVFSTPKPESLIHKIITLATDEGDLVLDAFLGSGTTAAVAHKTNRKYIGIELGDHIQTHCITRLQKVIEGEQGGISKAVSWAGGGGFSFYKLTG